ICGMFRSGSTLVEQILAAHKAFVPAGEREFFHRLVARQFPHYPYGVHALDRDSLPNWARQYKNESRRVFGDDIEGLRITDKRPDNFLYLGLIKAMFPKTKIVVTRRDWRDVAWSIYATRLGRNQNYATALADTRHYIEQHDRLIAHWEQLLGDDLHTVRYEQLIAEPELTIGAMLEFLGEAFDENCLRFNELENTVRTASVWQVRQPLYSTSVGRWRPFEQLVPEVFGDDTGD
ncbi:MAG: sulfotransferase, partial [Pseudomonadales bacterium]